MIIDNTYFKGEIYLPEAKPSITDSEANIGNDIIHFINEYSVDCLVKCLGPLFYEFKENLDPSMPNGLEIAAEAKWDHLLNGFDYIDPRSNKRLTWRGLRYSSSNNGVYDKSLIANYVYFYFERSSYITRTDIGNAIIRSKNSTVVVPTDKAVNSWNKFVEEVQGSSAEPRYYNKKGRVGIDYFAESSLYVSLNKFILDYNLIEKNAYNDFKPSFFRKINVFGL